MKREILKELLGDQASDELIDKIMAEHGKGIEKFKTDLSAAQQQLEGVTNQLSEANKQIESFKGMDIEGVKKSADEWKSKAEQAAQDAADQVNKLKFDHALESALIASKAKNPKAVTALLNKETLHLVEDGSISGLKEQLEAVQKDNDYLFESEAPEPKIVLSANNQTTISDPVIFAARKAAGLTDN